MRATRLLILALAALGLAACGIIMPTPTPAQVVAPLAAAAPAQATRAGVTRTPAPATTPAPAATPSPSPTWVLRAPLSTGVPAALATLQPQPTTTPTPGAPEAQPAVAGPSVSGRIVLQTSSGGAIVTVNAVGSQATTVGYGLDPAWSPDGKQIAFARWSGQQGIYVMNADGSNQRLVHEIAGAKSPTWSPDGKKIAFTWLYKQVRREPRPGQPTGLSSSVRDYWRITVLDLATGKTEDVPLDPEGDAFSPSWGAHGLFVYKAVRGLWMTGETGTPWAISDNPLHVSPVWSPDGERVAFMVQQHDHWDIAMMNRDGSGLTFLTSSPTTTFTQPVNNVAPAWSPDGRSIAFLSNREGDWRVYVMNADGANQRRLLDMPIAYEFAAERVLSWTK
jgi:dipeptidyl aminopeptidase/acylaminoacyl peptidase